MVQRWSTNIHTSELDISLNCTTFLMWWVGIGGLSFVHWVGWESKSPTNRTSSQATYSIFKTQCAFFCVKRISARILNCYSRCSIQNNSLYYNVSRCEALIQLELYSMNFFQSISFWLLFMRHWHVRFH